MPGYRQKSQLCDEDSHSVDGPCRRLKWYQISLRNFIAIAVGAGILLGWLVIELNQAARQRQAAHVIERFWAVDYDYELQGHTTPPGLKCLHTLLGVDFFFDVEEVWLGSDFSCLTVGLGDDLMPANDEEVIHLRSFPKLKRLYLGTDISDSSLVHLTSLTSLRELHLVKIRGDGSGLRHLKGLVGLEKLQIVGTSFSEAAIDELRVALPKCRICVIPLDDSVEVEKQSPQDLDSPPPPVSVELKLNF